MAVMTRRGKSTASRRGGGEEGVSDGSGSVNNSVHDEADTPLTATTSTATTNAVTTVSPPSSPRRRMSLKPDGGDPPKSGFLSHDSMVELVRCTVLLVVFLVT